MEALTGKKAGSRKRHLSPSDALAGPSISATVLQALASTAPDQKEIIPPIFRNSVPSQKKRINSEYLLKSDEVEELKNIPSDTEATLHSLRSAFPVEIFEGRLPPVFLYSQLSALVDSKAVIDHQLKKLAQENKILTFSLFSSSNYLIVFFEDFVKLERKSLFQRFVGEVLGEGKQPGRLSEETTKSNNASISRMSISLPSIGGGCKRSPENSKLVSKESLFWKFKEDEIRQLVNGGYLGVQEGGYYCVSLPSAGEFIRMYEKGKKAVINSVKRAKFGEILQRELEQRPMKKTAPLGVPYHIYDLLGSGEISKVDTTSGPLLRIKRELPFQRD